MSDTFSAADFEPLAVLIVDDEAPARERLRDLLGDIAESQPTRILGMAANGVEALALLERETVDLILTDIRMPLMDGIALALAAKQQFPELTIMLMTGYAEQRERAKSLESIVSEVMAKPFTIADLRATVMKVIERSIG